VHSLNLPSIPLLCLWNQRTPARSAHGGNNNYIQEKNSSKTSAATAVCSVNSFQKSFKNAEEELLLSLDDEIRLQKSE
jgi:hypothetical protein